MAVLNRKLWRDLRHLRGQSIAIGLVIAAGLATFIMSLSTLNSLRATQEDFYNEFQFAEVFVTVNQAPADAITRMRQIPGVRQVETRVTGFARIDIPRRADAADGTAPGSALAADDPQELGGRLVSIPDTGQPALNQIFLRRGRLPDPARPNEAVVSESFADAHGLQPGDTLEANIEGRAETLRLVGIGLSPDFIYQFMPGGAFPGAERFGVYWMGETALARALDMQGAWNEASLTLAPGTDPRDVVDALDAMLDRYGGLGAYTREDQPSHAFLEEEFNQLQQIAGIFPLIFLGVAAFLLNIVMNRLIGIERETIATLKAFGYSGGEIAFYYLKLVALLVAFGIAAGIMLGLFMGNWLSGVYMQYFRFPYLVYRLDFPTVAAGIGIVLFAAALGTWRAVRRSGKLPPAQAMQPEPPPSFRKTFIERLGLQRFLSQPTRMILRNFERRPIKSALSVIAVAFACAIVIMGTFFLDALDKVIDVEFRHARNESLFLPLREGTHARALGELRGISGVAYAEGFRAVPIRLRNGHLETRTDLEGIPADSQMRLIVDMDFQVFPPPSEGILLNAYLARSLQLEVGDTVIVEVLEGRRPVAALPVMGIVDQLMGTTTYMELSSLNRLMKEGHVISYASVLVDAGYEDSVRRELEERPRVAAIVDIAGIIADFYETIADQLVIYFLVMSIFASFIAVGVIYNTARIGLSERSRELASLRVLGFTRGEISYILLGELALITLLAIPLGLLIGRGMAAYLIAAFSTEMFRMPLVIAPDTYAAAALVVLVAASVSALAVRRRLDRLDLIGVLKTRE
jgi:putative ABC transport system permease protein